MKRHELTQEQWNTICPLLPPERKVSGGRPAKDNRMMMNAIIYWLNTGIAWRDMAERFGPWESVYTRYRRWTQQGIWEKVLEALIARDIVDETTLMLDGTIVKVHQHGSGAKKGLNTQPVEVEEG